MPEKFKQDYQAFAKQDFRYLIGLLRIIKNIELRVLWVFRNYQISKGIKRWFFAYWLKRYKKTLGIELASVLIEGGIRLIHPFGITVNKYAQIGKNVTLHKGVTIGVIDQGKRKGCPIIEDQVTVFAHAVICGGITIGTGAIIGPNSFVNFDVPDNAIVIGNPGQVHKKS